MGINNDVQKNLIFYVREKKHLKKFNTYKKNMYLGKGVFFFYKEI